MCMHYSSCIEPHFSSESRKPVRPAELGWQLFPGKAPANLFSTKKSATAHLQVRSKLFQEIAQFDLN